MHPSPWQPSRRQMLTAGVAAGVAGLAGPAQATAPGAADLSQVPLRIATYKGNWRALLTAANALDTPYKIDWRELSNGVLHIEAINGDGLDLGSGSEIPAPFCSEAEGAGALHRGGA